MQPRQPQRAAAVVGAEQGQRQVEVLLEKGVHRGGGEWGAPLLAILVIVSTGATPAAVQAVEQAGVQVGQRLLQGGAGGSRGGGSRLLRLLLLLLLLFEEAAPEAMVGAALQGKGKASTGGW